MCGVSTCIACMCNCVCMHVCGVQAAGVVCTCTHFCVRIIYMYNIMVCRYAFGAACMPG